MTRTIIISSGDISDVDGFFAISHYAKTGADVLFVMNYPGYIAIKDEILEFDKENPGLGYRYSSKTVPFFGHFCSFFEHFRPLLISNFDSGFRQHRRAFGHLQEVP
mmetsp:Transcript_89168/g.238046  ORF Transcript_89168/g.238046 Transcript_89168/m.238046 type:complete len:106 (-) Transcript_89168:1451-1768(-)